MRNRHDKRNEGLELVSRLYILSVPCNCTVLCCICDNVGLDTSVVVDLESSLFTATVSFRVY